jgi:exosome complex component RRP41
MEFLSPEGLRLDGRRPTELRRTSVDLGVLPQADGSAWVEAGNTRVLAAVFGPYVLPGSRSGGVGGADLRCEVSTAAFSTSKG